MSVILLTSAGGSVGVTTTGLALALRWPRDVLFADCDRDPNHSVLAGYLLGTDPTGLGLPSIALAHREGRDLTRALTEACLPLATEHAQNRWFLPGFSHPGGSELFAGCWTGLLEALRAMNHSGTDILLDGGRIGRTGLPIELLRGVDTVLVCCQTNLRSLAALRLYLPGLMESVAAMPTTVRLLLIGENRPYSAAEVQAQFGVDIQAVITHDVAAASVYSDGNPPPRRFADSPYRRSILAAANGLSTTAESTPVTAWGGPW